MLLEEVLKCPDCGGNIKKEYDDALSCDRCKRCFNPIGGIHSLLPLKKHEIPKFYDDEDHRQYLRHVSDVHKHLYVENKFLKKLDQLFKNGLNTIVKPIDEETTIADIGCGTGTSFNFLQKQYNIIGVDCNIDLLKIAKLHKKNIQHKHLIQADMYNSPFQDGKFEAIFCIATLEHIFYLEAFLSSIEKMLSSTGFFYVLIPTEGGLAWSIGRALLTSRVLSKKYSFNYNNALRKEHCNNAVSIDNALRKFFIVDEFIGWPFAKWRSVHANAIFLYRLKKY